MAKFVNSLYSPNKSGRLGSSVFGKNKFGGPYEKMLGLPSNPRTDAQMNRRSQFASLTRKWASLSDAQRTGWDNLAADYTFSKGGISLSLSGFMFFVMLNSNLQVIGSPIITTAPRLSPPLLIETFSVSLITTPGAEDIKMDFTPVIPVGTKLEVLASKIILPGRKPQQHLMRNIGVVDNTFLTGGSIKNMYLAKYGEMPLTGDKVRFQVKAVNTDDGFASLPLSFTAIGTP